MRRSDARVGIPPRQRGTRVRIPVAAQGYCEVGGTRAECVFLGKETRMLRERWLLCVVVFFCVLASCASQTVKGSGTELVGVVTDPAGATLPKARVMLIDLSSLETRKLEVPASGSFEFNGLQPREYAVVVVGPASPYSPCWMPAVRQIRITAGEPTKIRVPLLLDNERCPEIIE